jgi:hypothetical protein
MIVIFREVLKNPTRRRVSVVVAGSLSCCAFIYVLVATFG